MSSAIRILNPLHVKQSLDQQPPSQPTTPAPTTPSTPFSAASVANAAVFVPNFGTTSSGSGTNTPGGTSVAGAVGAHEFVPRRVETPALSEDAPFFTPSQQLQRQPPPPPPPGLNNGFLPGSGQQSSGGQVDALAEYYGQQMDMGGGDYGLHHGAPPPPHLQHGAGGAGADHQQGAGTAPPPGMYDYAHAMAHNGAPGGDPYYGAGGGLSHFVRQPLQYHLYHPLPSSTTSQHTHGSFFLPPSLHLTLTNKSEATHATPSVDMKLPEEVGGYTGLMPLDKGVSSNGVEGNQSGWNGYRSWLYKGWKETDGKAYALRRIEGFRLQHEAAISVVEKWTRVRHPGLVSVREAFTTRAFGDQSIIFVYDFHASSSTLYEAHLSPLSSLPPNPWSTPQHHHHHPHHPQQGLYRARPPGSSALAAAGGASGNGNGGGGGGGAGLPERVLWSYIVQLGSTIKAVHNSGLALRTLEVNRVVVTGKNRVRVGGCGVMDVLAFDGGASQGGHQQDDLLAFGKLIISLACGATHSVQNLPKSVDHIARVYSPDLKNVVLYLLSKPGPRKTIEEVLALMGARVLDELNSSFVAEDTLEAELMRELENGRLVRLLAKFGFINERPEFDHDPRWAETGDRYIIKLFRDYVFHQVDENGRPVTDLSHVLTCLNKLDAGVDEKIMLVSRDEQSCLIVSYREVKNCVDGAFVDLSRV